MKTSRPHDWWRRAVADGKECEQRGREKFFQEYRDEAEQALLPGPVSEMNGPFLMLYRMGFRIGYDNAKDFRKRGGMTLHRPRKRDNT